MSQFIEQNIDGFNKPVFFNPKGYLSKGGKYYTLEESIHFVKTLPAFKNWFEKTDNNFREGFESVNILEIYPFVNYDKPIGFVMIDAKVKYNGVYVPGAAFLRGGAVAILTILEDKTNNNMYVVNTLQPRVPGSFPMFEEIPAGMIDNSQNFGGVAAKELNEETGITIHMSELQKIGEMYPSVGGCDEYIILYRVVKRMEHEKINELQGKYTGNLEENETIILKVRTFADFANALKTGEIQDAKAMSAYAQHILNPIPSIIGGRFKIKNTKNTKKYKRKNRKNRKTK
jgi:ADP-sugar diphosphatase